MRKALAIGLFIGLLATPAWAESYRLAASDGNGTALLLDMDSITPMSDGTVRAWEVVIQRPEKRDLFAYARIMINVDCANKRTRRLSVTTYKSSGDVDFTSNDPTPWDYVMSETLIEGVHDLACGKAPQKDQVVVGRFSEVVDQLDSIGF